MKKRMTVVCMLTLITLLLSSCVIFLPQSAKEDFGETESSSVETSSVVPDESTSAVESSSSDLKAEEIAVFTDQSLRPMQFSISEDGKFVYLLQDDAYSKISVGDSATDLNVVYDAGGFYIKNMACGNGFTAWTELTDDAFAIKCYDHAKNETSVIRSGLYDFDTDYQVLVIKAYKDCVYYTYYDNEQDVASIMCYDVPSGSESTYMTADLFMPEKMVCAQYECLDLNDSWLLCSQRRTDGKQDVWMINLDTEANMLAHLNPDVSLVYGASFDESDSILALYYWDTASVDHIGTCSGTAEISNWVDFGSTSIAYRDRIRYIDGHLYYIEQSEKNGHVDNFRFCDVTNNGSDTSYYADAFSYFIAEDGTVYLLTRDSGWASVSLKRLESGV